jgi:hypothetical protein
MSGEGETREKPVSVIFAFGLIVNEFIAWQKAGDPYVARDFKKAAAI